MIDISIIIPVFNLENYLPKCLDRVCAQSDCVKEIIIVNDGSTDRSLRICNEYAQKDSRIKIIDRQNGGVASAVIEGVLASTCNYVGFVDGDDYIESDMFEKLANAIVEFDGDIAFCDYDDVDENGNASGRRDFGIAKGGLYIKQNGAFPIGILPNFSDGRYISGMRWNKLFKRELLVNCTAFKNTDIRIGEDIALVIPVLMSAERLVYVKECMYHYLQRRNSAAHSYVRKNLDDWKTINAILREAADVYNYSLGNFNETKLLLLLKNCVSKIRRSGLTKAQKKEEYKYIGNVADVRNALNSVKFYGKFKEQLVLRLLKYKLYGLLTLIYH